MSDETGIFGAIIRDVSTSTIRVPPPNKWQFTPGNGYMRWYTPEGEQPNACHRFMQRWLLGIRWSRLP